MAAGLSAARMKGETGMDANKPRSMAVFIDADNMNDPTALDHVLLKICGAPNRVLYRRAYGRPESLKGIEAVLWRHGVRPVTNLVVDKVTTDSALVIDVVEAVCTSDIDTIAICSGDTDFVPLALWLREKGRRVVCFSLSNKIFANPESYYDGVVVIDIVEKDAVPPKETDAAQSELSASVAIPAMAVQASPVSEPVRIEVSQQTASGTKPPGNRPNQETSAGKPTVKKLLAALPELRSGQPLHLSVATRKLRDAGLLGKNASSPTLFRNYVAQFELIPENQPNAVRYRG